MACDQSPHVNLDDLTEAIINRDKSRPDGQSLMLELKISFLPPPALSADKKEWGEIVIYTVRQNYIVITL